jgi:AcrR family transcriptional regulator
MEPATTDRRAQRSRELLNMALIELLHAKRYDLISVQDIVARANVSRSTFYLHYQDKDDLLAGSFRHLLEELDRHRPPSDVSELRLLPALEMFQHVQQHRALYQSVVGGRGLDVLFKTGRDYWGKNIEQIVTALPADAAQSSIPLPVLITHITGAFLTLLKWWLDNRLPYPPERMAAMFEELVTPGTHVALGMKR